MTDSVVVTNDETSYIVESVGEVGPQGEQGIQGETGLQGVQGQKGDTGLTGPQGPQGIQGVQGPKGDQGDIGPQGLQGSQGAAGEPGTSVRILGTVQAIENLPPNANPGEGYVVSSDGDLYFYTDLDGWTSAGQIVGPEGPQGPQGIQGTQGIQGEAGPQGIQGIQGIQGDKGDTGATGPAGNVRPLISGKWYTYEWAGGSISALSFTPLEGRLMSAALNVYQTITIDRIGIVLSTYGSTGSVLRLGIYNDSGFYSPGTLLLDAGTVAGTDTGSGTTRTISLNSLQLQTGTYWLAIVHQGGSSTRASVYGTSNSSGDSRVYPSSDNPISATFSGYRRSSVTGALDVYNDWVPNSSNLPLLSVRVV